MNARGKLGLGRSGGPDPRRADDGSQPPCRNRSHQLWSGTPQGTNSAGMARALHSGFGDPDRGGPVNGPMQTLKHVPLNSIQLNRHHEDTESAEAVDRR
jgi:hypothetical protein